MAINIPDGYTNATVIMTCDGSINEKTFSIGFIQDPVTPLSDVDAAHEVLNGLVLVGGPFQPASLLDDWVVRGVSVTTMVDGAPLISAYMETHAGVAAADSPPSNSAMLVKKVTALGGRHNRGRMFVPCAAVNEVAVNASGIFGAGEVANHQARWNFFYSHLVTAGLLPVLFHSSALDPTAITGLSVESQLATQRRRMR